MEEEQIESNEKEKELDLLKARFISLVSHEFRTPLTTILSSVELLENYSDKLTGEEKSNIYQSIKIAIDRMTGLLDNVSILGKADSGKLSFNPGEVNLEKFCLDLLDEFKQETHRISFSNHSAFSSLFVDKDLLRNILINLISNSLKYSPDRNKISFELICQDGKAIFIVKDRGIGIPQEDQNRIFEAFHRAGNVGNIPGTGLGFTIVKHCLELHKGTININSVIGEGTTVTVTIPPGEQNL